MRPVETRAPIVAVQQKENKQNNLAVVKERPQTAAPVTKKWNL